MQNALIVAQVAVSMVLLVGAGLLLASFYRSQTVDPGYRANHVLSAEAFTNFSKYPDIGAQLRFYQPVLEVFAALALLVTMAGITGVIATSVSQRTQEFGVRIVLGASRGRVLGQVIGRGLTLVAIGLAIGAAASAASTRALSAYLFDTAPTDPATFVAVAVSFVLAAAVACAGARMAGDDRRSDAGAARRLGH